MVNPAMGGANSLLDNVKLFFIANKKKILIAVAVIGVIVGGIKFLKRKKSGTSSGRA